MTGVAESTYHYYASKQEIDKDAEIKVKIIEIFNESRQTYGYRRITKALHNQQIIINHKKVLRIMRDLNLTCTKFSRKSRRYKSYKGKVGKIAKNKIKRRFKAKFPLQKLTTDVTEFKCLNGEKLYLSPILDMYNSEIISYKVSKSPKLDIAIDPLNEAIETIKNKRDTEAQYTQIRDGNININRGVLY